MPIHLLSSSHWIVAIIIACSCEIMLIDSYPNKRQYEISQILLQWLWDTHYALNRPFFPALWTIIYIHIYLQAPFLLIALTKTTHQLRSFCGTNSCILDVVPPTANLRGLHSTDYSQAAFLHAVCSLSCGHTTNTAGCTFGL